MDRNTETLDKPEPSGGGSDVAATPGLILVSSAGQPTLATISTHEGETLVLGRGAIGPTMLDDPAISRQHARIRLADGVWHVHDLGSRNGTLIDGRRIDGRHTARGPTVIRIGASLFLPRSDIRPFRGAVVEVKDGVVMGPVLGQTMAVVARAARASSTLHITGESGSGKEIVARAFHQLGPCKTGPFVAVNCATLPEGLAERLLFGTRRGAYSGATDNASGFIQSASGGTLFLDEIAELDLAVQSKLLRVLETHEVIPLGATQAQTVQLRICSASHRSLRELVALRHFREDLYFRIARPEVVVPPLRDRGEEIPWLIERQLGEHPTHVSLAEECLLRRWPGNVRELLAEVRAAALAAGDEPVEGRHLSDSAGGEFDASPRIAHRTAPPSSDEIRAALRHEHGNVTRAAARLGLHRTQLRRWLEKKGGD